MKTLSTGPQSEKTLNIIRGKNIVGHATQEDVFLLFEHIDALERMLDTADLEDTFGTEGWRHFLNVPE